MLTLTLGAPSTADARSRQEDTMAATVVTSAVAAGCGQVLGSAWSADATASPTSASDAGSGRVGVYLDVESRLWHLSPDGAEMLAAHRAANRPAGRA
jgi:hypothetical protein